MKWESNSQTSPDVGDWSFAYEIQGGVIANIIKYGFHDDGFITVRRTGFLESDANLSFLRHYCHLREAVLEHGDSFKVIFEKYKMCAAYNLEGAAVHVAKAAAAQLDAASCLTVLNEYAGTEHDSSDIVTYAREYFLAHAQDVFKKVATSKITEACSHSVYELLGRDEANVDEAELMEDIFLTTSKRDEDFENVFVECVRTGGLTLEGIMTFRERHPGIMDDSFTLKTMSQVFHPPARARSRRYEQRSNFPLDISFPGGGPDSPRVMTPLVERGYGVAYVAVPVLRRGSADVPPFPCAGGGVMSVRAVFREHVSMSIGVDVGLLNATSDLVDVVEIKVVNFRKDRSRKISSASPKRGEWTEVDKIVLTSTLDNEGYLFDPDRPRERGSFALFKFCTKIFYK
jgi:hypothetical protein